MRTILESTAVPLIIIALSLSLSLAEKTSTKSNGLSCYSGRDLKIQSCKSNVTHCYYTKTIEGKDLKFHKDAQPFYSMSCDESDVCFNKTEHKFINIDESGNQTKILYCCSENKCNKPNDLKKYCYNIIKTKNISTGMKDTCESFDSRCTKITTNKNNENKEEYFSCQHNKPYTPQCLNVTSSTETCFNISLNGSSAELCCCFGDYCLNPTFNFTDSHESLNLTFNGTLWIKGDAVNPSTSQDQSNTDWLFNGGLIAGGVLILLIIGVAIVIAIKCRKKKETNRMMLSYKRIAADETTDDEDVRMLLG